MRTSRIGHRLRLGPNRSRGRDVIARLKTCPAHGAELSVCRNVVATMRTDASGGAQHRRRGRGFDFRSAYGTKHRVVSDFAMAMSTNHECIPTLVFSIWAKYKPTNGTRSSSFTEQRGSECSKNLPDVPRYMKWHPCNKTRGLLPCLSSAASIECLCQAGQDRAWSCPAFCCAWFDIAHASHHHTHGQHV